MKNIKLSLWGILIGLTGLWLLADTFFPDPFVLGKIRHVWVLYSGVIGISIMSFAMILATRPRWLEPILGGLDKSYRLHKWLGITGLVFAILHWGWAKGFKYAVWFGFLERPARRGQPPGEDELNMVEQLFRTLHGPAEFVGEWAFYAVVILISLALIKRFPYKIFAETHYLIAIVYLVLVFHSAILMEMAYWTQPIGLVVVLLQMAGTYSAIMVMFNLVGRKNKVDGKIEKLEYFPSMHVLETVVKLNGDWRGHHSGQFAFVTHDPNEGAHPYTISSAWDPKDRRVTFITKALGDYTKQLPDHLQIGQHVMVEGPYGQFTFNDDNKRQIWVGGGIGITPFIARMRQLAQTPGEQNIDLIHTTTELEPTVAEKLNADVAASKVNLHLLIDSKDGLLTGERLRKMVPDWNSASIWFCGPAGLGQALKEDLIANGLRHQDFHQELFNMR